MSEGIRLILEELADLRREALKYSQNADSDRRQAAEDRSSFAEYIRNIHKAERQERQELTRALERLGAQQITLAKILGRQNDKVDHVAARIDHGNQVLGEIRDLLRRNGKP